MIRTEIIGAGHYVPARVVTNHDLEQWMDTSDEWIRERTGIRTRRWIEPGETVHGMGLKATQKALQRAGIEAGE
ncbi:MAG: 3-oxoacyl-ACP synthase, partial [Calditrichaeota bacterium]